MIRLLLPLTLLLGLLAPGTAAAQNSACPTFTVLHNDRIGSLSVPRGTYSITPAGGLTCARASAAFTQFLQDYDGRLPRPWTLDVSSRQFSRGDSGLGFTIRRSGRSTGGGGGGGGGTGRNTHPTDGTLCGGTFAVLNNDRIGQLTLPKGAYLITLLRGGGLTCQQASTQFAAFLQLPAGNLPSPWKLAAATGTFTKARNQGFRVKAAPPGTTN